MPDIGWMELMVIGIVALIVVGPKDLPVMFRKAGMFVGRIKGMAREFSSAMNEAADQSGMRDMNREMKALTNPRQYGLDKLKSSLNADLDLDADFNSDTPLKTGNQSKPAQGNPTQAPAPAVKASTTKAKTEATSTTPQAEPVAKRPASRKIAKPAAAKPVSASASAATKAEAPKKPASKPRAKKADEA